MEKNLTTLPAVVSPVLSLESSLNTGDITADYIVCYTVSPIHCLDSVQCAGLRQPEFAQTACGYKSVQLTQLRGFQYLKGEKQSRSNN